jgi:hypothetical protein
VTTMKATKVLSFVSVVGLLSVFGGCSATEETTDIASEHETSSWRSEDGSELSISTDAAGTLEGQAIQSGCSVVEYCNAPGSNGAVCRQEGCTLGNALAECDRETRDACGSPPLCPWIFIRLNGQRANHISCL